MSWTPPQVPQGTALRAALPIEGWRGAAARILARHGLPAQGLAPFDSGSDVVWGTPEHVVKLSEPRWADEIAAEAAALGHVAGRLPVETPAVVATGALSGWPYVVMTRVAGRSLGSVWPGLDRGARLALAAELGRLAAALHALPVPADGRWPGFLAERRAGAVAHHRARGTSQALLAQIEPFLRGLEPLSSAAPVFLHTELLDEHVLVSPGPDGRWAPCALIDFADSRVGHPWYDFAALVEFVFKGEPGCLRACLSAYGISDAALDDPMTGRRLAAWALLHRFASLPRALAAAGEPPPVTLVALATRLYTP